MDPEAHPQVENQVTDAALQQPAPNSIDQQPTPPPPSSALPEQAEEKPVVTIPQILGQEQELSTPIKTGTPDLQDNKANVTPLAPEPPKQKLTETELLRERLKRDPLDTSAHQRLIGIAEASGDVEKIQDAYEGLLAAFPNATSAQIAYLNHFLTPAYFNKAELLFSRFLRNSISPELWKFYLAYVRRTNPSTTDPQTREVVKKAFEFALLHIGQDRAAGDIWREYIDFVKAGEAKTTWEEQQKMDALRRLYHRAVVIPLENVEQLWRELDQFENGLNKITAKKFLADLSPSYMTARTALRELRRLLDPLEEKAAAPPRDPAIPAPPDFNLPTPPTWTESDRAAVQGWKAYVKWEESNPLDLDDTAAWHARVSAAHRKACAAMQFYPEIWYLSYNWANTAGKPDDAMTIIKQGMEANKSSFLLHFAYNEICEVQKKYPEVHATFEGLVDALHVQLDALDNSIKEEVAAAKANAPPVDFMAPPDEQSAPSEADNILARRTPELNELKSELGVVWIMYMRFARRSEGLKPARTIFGKARKDKHIFWNVYEAAALMEYHCTKAPDVATKIFELGLKVFSDNPDYVLRYLGFLISVNDENNARALFERVITTFTPEKARPIWDRWSRYEYNFGDLIGSQKLEKRLAEIYPNDPPIKRFANRYTYLGVDTIALNDLGFKVARQAGPSTGGANASPPNSAAKRAASPPRRAPDPPAKRFKGQGQDNDRAREQEREREREQRDRDRERERMERERERERLEREKERDRERERERGDRGDRRGGRWEGPSRRPNSPPPYRRGYDGPGRRHEDAHDEGGIPPLVAKFVASLPAPQAFDGPVFRTDDLLTLFKNVSLPTRSPPPPRMRSRSPPRGGRPPPDYGPYQGPGDRGQSRRGRSRLTRLSTIYTSIGLGRFLGLRSMSRISLQDVRVKTLAATRPTLPRDISGTITLTEEENSICTLLDEFTKSLRESGEEFKGVECRIAGGWVRDKLLGIPSNDIDIALADIMGTAFAEKLQAYMASKNLEDKSTGRSATIATIARNPEQSKHLETARMKVLGHEVDFVNLRSETYAGDSRIPEIRIGTPLEDALRRDITINALFYNGLPDLREGIARTPLAALQTFQDDPLRVLRCVRFSSRFGLEIAEEAGNAMQEQSIQDALIRKIARERVGEEFLKMLKGKSPLLSLATLENYGIYDTVFGVPPDIQGKTTGRPRPQSIGTQAASILCSFLDSVPTSLPAPHSELLKLAREDHGLRQRLIFGAALTPWRDMTYPQKKGELSVVQHIVKEGLKIGSQNHFIPSVPRLFTAHKRVSKPSLDKFEGLSQRSLIGLLLRDVDVHSTRTGTYWSTSLLFSMVQDLVDLIDNQNTLDDAQAQQIVETYNAFVDRVLELDLVKSIEEPPRLNGKEISAILGIKPGKEIGMYTDHIIRWQLDHPNESVDVCKTWLKELHRSLVDGGSGSATPPPKRARVKAFLQLRSHTMFLRFAAAGLATLSLLPRVHSRSNWFDQSFFFAWGDSSAAFTVPTTTQCETIKIKWDRGAATGPDPVAPYTLQILTSNYIVPFYIDAGSSRTYDFTVPFAPGTQYQICMYDSKGQTGGCQATYTVIPAMSTPSCANMTFPQTLEVDAKSSTGPLSQYGWPNQCTDISVTPKSGTPPFTFTAAPALHPPVNITSNSMAPINWTIDLSWGSPFFVTLADSAGLMWSYGPLHSGGNGPDTCLSSGTSSVPMGATVGAVVGAFVIGGVLASLLFFFVSRKKSGHGMVGGGPSLGLRESLSGRELRPTPYITSPDSRAVYSPLGTREESHSTFNSSRPMLRAASRSSFGREPIGLATTGLQAEPFDPVTVSTTPTITGSSRHELQGSSHRSSSPPMSPVEGHVRSESGRDTRSQVYVVHHDGGRAPVTIMTSDGAEVVELPPGYSSVPESSRQRATTESNGRSLKGALGR